MKIKELISSKLFELELSNLNSRPYDWSSYSNIKEARTGIDEYINTYNTERLHSALDYLTPDEAYYEGANNKCFDAKSVLLGVA